MSGILKPIILPDGTETSGGPVPADYVLDYYSLDRKEGAGVNQKDAFDIVFKLDKAAGVRNIYWRYATSAARDAAALLVDNTLGAVVA